MPSTKPIVPILVLAGGLLAIAGCRREGATCSCATSGKAAAAGDPARGPEGAAWFQSGAPVRRVGTVERDALVMAYYRSRFLADDMAALKAEHAAASASGDAAKVAQLERQGEALQDRAHGQLWRGESLDPIIDRIRDRLPEVAAAAGVDRIAEAGTALPESAVAVDITDRILALLPPAS